MNFITENIGIISFITDVIGVIVIVVSVLYLAKQTNQANIQAQGNSERQMFDSFNELIYKYSDKESVKLIQRALDKYKDLPNYDKARFCLIYFIPHMNFLDQVLGLYRKKLLNQDRFITTTNMIIAILKTSGGMQAWQEVKYSYRITFVEFINERLANSKKTPSIMKIMTGFKLENQIKNVSDPTSD